MTEAVEYRLGSVQIEKIDMKSSKGERDDVRVGRGREGMLELGIYCPLQIRIFSACSPLLG